MAAFLWWAEYRLRGICKCDAKDRKLFGMLPYSKVNYNTYKHWPWVYPFHILQPKSNAESTVPHRGACCTIRQHQIGRLFAGTCMQPLVRGVVHEVKKKEPLSTPSWKQPLPRLLKNSKFPKSHDEAFGKETTIL